MFRIHILHSLYLCSYVISTNKIYHPALSFWLQITLPHSSLWMTISELSFPSTVDYLPGWFHIMVAVSGSIVYMACQYLFADSISFHVYLEAGQLIWPYGQCIFSFWVAPILISIMDMLITFQLSIYESSFLFHAYQLFLLNNWHNTVVEWCLIIIFIAFSLTYYDTEQFYIFVDQGNSRKRTKTNNLI